MTQHSVCRFRTLVALTAYLCIGFSHATAEPASLNIEDLNQITAFPGRSPIALSPDGQIVAYTLLRPHHSNPLADERYRYYSPSGTASESVDSELWISDTRSGDSRSLGARAGSSWAPAWSPDGKVLAFYSDRSGTAALWIWERATSKVRKVSDTIVHALWGFQVPAWTPDSQAILTRVMPENLTLDQALELISPLKEDNKLSAKDTAAPNVLVFTSRPQSLDEKSHSTELVSAMWFNAELADLALIDVVTGSEKRIARSVRPRGYWISPDGRSLAFTNAKGVEPKTQFSVFELLLQPLDGAQARVIVPEFRQDYGISVSWSPDGNKLAYATKLPGNSVDVCVVSVSNGEILNLTPGSHPRFDAHYGVPSWDEKGNLYLTAFSYSVPATTGTDTIWKASLDGRPLSVAAHVPSREVMGLAGSSVNGRLVTLDGGKSLIALTRDDLKKAQGFWKVDLITGQASPLFEGNLQVGSPVRFSQDATRDGNTFVYIREDAAHPSDVWVTHADFENHKRISHANPQLNNTEMGASRVVEWESATGKLMRGALLLPPNYKEGKRYPLLTWVYGGAIGSDFVNTFGFLGGVFNLQLFATRGYAVLYPDAPVERGRPVKDLADSVLPGIDKLIEMGVADPERLAVSGWSYGAYSTLALLTQTDRFKAAIASAGFGNLVSYYLRMNEIGAAVGIGNMEQGQGNMRGILWDHLDEYIENSPVFHLDKVKTPLLLTDGTHDVEPLRGQLAEVFVGLRRLGQEVEYVRYVGEGHTIADPANKKDFCERRIRWLDMHLKPVH